MPEFVGFQTMGILVPYGITFDAVGVFGLAFHLLFKSCSTYCVRHTCFEADKFGFISTEYSRFDIDLRKIKVVTPYATKMPKKTFKFPT